MTKKPPEKLPRISANELASYMVSSETVKRSIIQRAKYPNKYASMLYIVAQNAACRFLSDRTRNIRHLTDSEEELKQAMTEADTSAQRREGKLFLGDIEVSVRSDLHVFKTFKGKDYIGGSILRLTKAYENEKAKNECEEMGAYAATLAYLHMQKSNPHTAREPRPDLCMSIDVRHGDLHIASKSTSRRAKDMDAACRSSAAIWPTITDPKRR